MFATDCGMLKIVELVLILFMVILAVRLGSGLFDLVCLMLLFGVFASWKIFK